MENNENLNQSDADDILWKKTQKSNSVYMLEKYLKEMPNGKYRFEAQNLLNNLSLLNQEKEKEYWEKVVNENTKEAFLEYVRVYPKGIYLKEAGVKLDELETTNDTPNGINVSKGAKIAGFVCGPLAYFLSQHLFFNGHHSYLTGGLSFGLGSIFGIIIIEFIVQNNNN